MKPVLNNALRRGWGGRQANIVRPGVLSRVHSLRPHIDIGSIHNNGGFW